MNPDLTGRRGKIRAKMVRATVLLGVGLSAWAGYFMHGMESRAWMMALAALGGLVLLFVGAMVAGVLYQEEHKRMSKSLEEMTQFSEATLTRMRLDLEDIEKSNKERRRQLCMASVVMAKVVSERVASRLVTKYAARFPNEEHLESAIRDANEVVAEEIVSYSESLAAPRKS